MQQPKSEGSRITILDALRGFALLGILLAHVSHWYAAGPLPAAPQDAVAHAGAAIPEVRGFKLPEFMSAAFVNGKFYPLFTFIFGFSFFLQTKSFARDGKQVNLLFFRRACCLLLIGFLHQMVWMGDILMVYAILMVPLIFLRTLPDRWVLVLGLLFVFNVPGILLEVLQALTHTRVVSSENHQADVFLHVISAGNWQEIIGYNLANLGGKLKFQAISGRIFITLGFFLLGMLAARRGWLNDIAVVKDKIYYLFLPSYMLLILLQLLSDSLGYAEMSGDIAEIVIGNLIISLQSICAIVVYTSFVAILYFSLNVVSLFTLLADIGRMALTCYLMQTVIGLLLFYHPGFGLFGKTSHMLNIAIGFVVFLLQVFFARIWFRYFNYGIVEWLLRAGTHGHFGKLRRG